MLSIYNKVSDYIVVLNCMGKIIFCNESFLKRLSYSEEELLNLNIEGIINNADKKNKKKIKEFEEINTTLNFYSKSKELIEINSNIVIENFNNERSIFIVGQEVKSEQYTKEMLEDLLDNINTSSFVINSEGKYLYANKAFTNITNKNKDDIIGTYDRDHWEADTYKEIEENNLEVVKNGNPKIFNEKVRRGGKVYWYESYKAPVFDKDKNLKYVVATTQNISLAKSISEELYKNYNITTKDIDLKESRKEDTNLCKVLSRIGGNILDYTKADGLSILMFDKERQGLIPFIKLKNSKKNMDNITFIPINIEEMHLEENRNILNSMFLREKLNIKLDENIKNMNEIEYIGNYVIQLGDEVIGFIALNYTYDNPPQFNCDEYMKYVCNRVAMIIKNIRLANQVLLANKKRKYTEEELEQYLNVSVDLVSIVGENGHFKRLSPNWYDVLGWSEEELLSMPISKIVHPEELKRFEGINDQHEQVTRYIIRFMHKNGNYVYLEWSSMYVKNQGIHVIAARDITRRLEIEKEKIQLEEAVHIEVVKNEFFSNISHEFRTPINIILGTMQLINKNIQQNRVDIEDLKKYTNYIKQNSYRLLRLVNNLIDISKMDIGMYELRCSNQNIISIIEEITLSVADYTKNNKINLVFDTNKEEVITYCDPDKVERIMLNLLSNAIKFTPEDGDIYVNIYVDEEVTVSVKDSGVGIPKDKLDLIFDRFGQVDDSFNRKCEGSGIGLSLVKNLVEMHGGRIKVNSEVDGGSEFIFTIPVIMKEEDSKHYDDDRKCKHVERCDIEFSDIYNV